MRYGIFSDVHGNLEALDVVLDFFASQRLDALAFLGDAVGYGANPNEVCARIRPHATLAVVGNHDAALVGRASSDDYYDAARASLDWCAREVTEENKAWLREQPFTRRDGPLAFCHGSPLTPEMFDYLFAPEQALELLGHYDMLAPVTFIGHSHLTLSFRLEPDGVTPLLSSPIVCEPGAKYIITVGSVGQPRDRDPRACCGIFDSETDSFSFHRLDYDIQLARQKILDAGLAPLFGERLLVGI